MVQPPHLEVLEKGPPPDATPTPRSRRLLQEIAGLLHLPPELAEQLALTHALADLQAYRPLHPQLLWDPALDHNSELDHA